MASVFVNYRSSDMPVVAGMLCDHLIARFGEDRVFRDCVSIGAGDHYPAALREGLQRASVLLVVIGPSWLAASDERGRRLLDRPGDWVRYEIKTALAGGRTVIQVLVGDTPLPKDADLPAEISALAYTQARRIKPERPTSDIESLIRELISKEPLLAVNQLFRAMPVLDTDSPPSTLLRPEYGVVPFIGRERELAKLHAWAGSPLLTSLQLVTGPGGQGKTRLARHFCVQLRDRGWTAGVVDPLAPEEVLRRCASWPMPSLLVFDYAETTMQRWVDLVSVLAERPQSKKPVRLLLLVRSAEADRMLRSDIGGTDRARAVLDTLDQDPMALPPLLPRDHDRHGEFDRAVRAFASWLGRPDAGVPAPVDLDHERYGRALDVHAAALASLLDHPDDRVDGRPRWPDPIKRVLDHEYDYWKRAATLLEGFDRDRCRQIAAVATMFGADDDQQAERLLSAVPAMAGDKAAVYRWLRWFQRLYPGPGALNPLQPDRLGEEHVVATVRAEPRVATGPARGASDAQLVRALTVLGRAAPRHEHLADAMSAMVANQPRRLIPLGFDVVPRIHDPYPLARVLDRAIDGADAGTVDAAVDVLVSTPTHGVALEDVAVHVSARALAIHRDEVRIASLQTSHALHLAAAGRWSEAMDAVAEAVDRHAALAEGTPARRYDLVRALHIQSRLLGRHGRHDQAVAAAELAVERCRKAGDLPELAASLTILAAQHAGLDRHGQAAEAGLEAIRIYRRLATAEPDAYQHQLARSLTVQAHHLERLSRLDGALATHAEANELLRHLTQRYPGVYDDQLAQQLGSEAQLLVAVGRAEDARNRAGEAAALCRERTEDRPGVFHPLLAEALDTLGVALTSIDALEEAEETLVELVSLRRELAERAPAARAHGLARSLRMLADVQRRTGRRDLAAATAAESTRRYRALPPDGPVVQRSELADFLHDTAMWSTADGDYDAAIDALSEASAILRELAAASFETHGAALARVLVGYAIVLGRRNRHDEAAGTGTEALTIFEELQGRWPDRHLPAHAGALHEMVLILAQADRREQAGRRQRELVAILRPLTARDPRYVNDLQRAVELGWILGLD